MPFLRKKGPKKFGGYLKTTTFANVIKDITTVTEFIKILKI